MKTRANWLKSVAILGCGFTILLLGGVETRAGALTPFAASGLRAQWTCAEGSGTTLGDSSGNGFNGVLTNGATWAPGRTGKGLSFDGVNDFVKLPDNLAILNSAPAASVSFWIKPSATTASGSFRELVSLSIGSSAATNTSRVAVSLQGNGAGGQVFAGGRSTDTETQKNTVTSTGVTVGTWTHVAAVFDFSGGTIKVYLNGTLSATNAAAGFASTSTPNTPCRSCTLGAQDTGDSNFYQGGMDDVLVYNRALSAAEVSTLAAGDCLSAHWTFDEGVGGTAGDSSGNNYNGTLTNGLAWQTGFMGSALNFDGVNDTLNLGSSLGVLQNVNAASVTAWIKPASTMAPNTFRELVSISVNNGSTPTDTSRLALALKGDGSAGALFFGVRSTDTEAQKNLTFSTNLQTNQWYHVGAVADFAGGTLAIYLNGILVASSNVTFAQSHTPNTVSTSAALGSQDTGTSNFFHGQMDEVRIYCRPLCACDMQNLAGKDGLRGYWKADEGTGSSLADSSGNTFTGTLKNGVTWANPGQVGNALSFGGVNGTVDLGSNLSMLQGVSAATLACWVKPAVAIPSGSYQDLVSISVNATNPTDTSRAVLSIQGNGTGGNVFTGARSTDTEGLKSFADTTNLTPGTWYHIASTIDYQNNRLQIYINGLLKSSTTVAFAQATTANTASRNAALGSQDAGDGNFLNGLLDEVRVYCRVLSAAEIQSLASVVPATPTGLQATAGDMQVSLTWNTSSGATSYNVKRSATSNGTYTVVGMANTTSFTDTGLTNGTTYFYKVSAANLSGESADSGFVSATPSAALPSAPTLSTPVAGDRQVALAWTTSTGATSYNVKRDTSTTGSFPTIANVTATSFTDTGLTNGTTYYYKISAQNSAGISGDSNTQSAQPTAPASAPPPPTGLSAVAVDGLIILNWNAAAGAASYNVKRGTVSGGETTLTNILAPAATFTDSGLTNGTPLFYVVTALNSTGESGPSNEASATPNVPPLPPTGLTGQAVGSETHLAWIATSQANIAGYNVYRSLNSNGPFTQKLNPSPVTPLHFEDLALGNGTYFYVIRAVSTSNQESGNSNSVGITISALAPPTGLAVAVSDAKVTLSWNAVPSAASYTIFRSFVSGGPYDAAGLSATNSFTDVGLSNGVAYFYVLTASDGVGSSLPSTEVSATPAPPSSIGVLFVVGNTTLSPGDSAIQTRLQNLKYTVTVRSDSAVASGDATGSALVLISASTNPGNVGTKFTNVAVPVITWQSGTFNALGMTGPTSGSDFGTASAQTQVAMVQSNSSHPMAAGLSGTIAVLNTADSLAWGVSNFAGVSIATLTTDSTKSVIFGYEEGASMPGLDAPARRVGVFLSATGATALTGSGGLLFDSAVRWAAGAANPLAAVNVIPTGTQLALQWESSANATSYLIYRSTSSTGPFTLIASGVTSNTYIDASATQANTTYYYQVVAQNGGGFSDPSVVASGSLNASPIIVTIDGPSMIPLAGGPDSQGVFTATVQQYVNGVPTNVAFTPSWSFANVPNNSTSSVTIQNPTSNPCSIATTSQAGTALIQFTALVGGASATTTFSVQAVGNRRTFVEWQFPQFAAQGAADALRTRRIPRDFSNNTIWANDGASDLDRDRGTARIELWGAGGATLANTVDSIWKQATIQFEHSQVNKLGPTFTVAANEQDAGNRIWVRRNLALPGQPARYDYTDIVKSIRAQNQGLAINIWFVFALFSQQSFDENQNAPIAIRGQLEGFTYNTTVRNPNRLTILIADAADGGTVAHEIGHAFGLPHVRGINDVDGPMATLASLATTAAGVNTVLAGNLMWEAPPGVTQDRTGTQLMENQQKAAQREMDAMKNQKMLGVIGP